MSWENEFYSNKIVAHQSEFNLGSFVLKLNANYALSERKLWLISSRLQFHAARSCFERISMPHLRANTSRITQTLIIAFQKASKGRF
jgi:hypothetical protein